MAQAQLTQKIIFSQEQKQVLNGAMLGDGCLYLNKNGINAQFIYGSKSKQHVTFVGNFFKDFWSGQQIKDLSYNDKRTNKTYFRSVIKTYTNSSFTEEYYRWYINNIKHIPNDLVLTPLTCLIWYIGDGGICHNPRSEYIKLSTQCFTKEQQQRILLPQLSSFEASLMKADIGKNNQQQYFIYIPHRQEENFLHFIGQCPFSDYDYKWQVTPYKNKMPQNHTDKEQIFCELYNQGETYYQIAKRFNIEPNAVKYYLIKNNIYKSQKNNKTKNAVVQYNKENIPINIYISAAQAGRQNNINNTGISQCCSKTRSQAGGYYWKKFKNLSQEEQELLKIKFKQYFNN